MHVIYLFFSKKKKHYLMEKPGSRATCSAGFNERVSLEDGGLQVPMQQHLSH